MAVDLKKFIAFSQRATQAGISKEFLQNLQSNPTLVEQMIAHPDTSKVIRALKNAETGGLSGLMNLRNILGGTDAETNRQNEATAEKITMAQRPS